MSACWVRESRAVKPLYLLVQCFSESGGGNMGTSTSDYIGIIVTPPYARESLGPEATRGS